MIMKKQYVYFASLILLGSILTIVGCKENDNSNPGGSTKVEVRMTDAPGNFDAINLSVKEIVLMSEDEESYTLSADIPSFNILDFRLGTSSPDILVATAEVPSGNIKEVRLVLNETGNTIVVDGEEYELKTPSAQSSGWKIKLTEDLNLVPDITYSLLLDFDAARSIVLRGNGEYLLKPVVRGISIATSGLISGTVSPIESHPEILAIQGTDTVGTIADPTTGEFTLGGLSGDYDVKFVPVEGFRDSTINDVSVVAGENNNLGTIVLETE